MVSRVGVGAEAAIGRVIHLPTPCADRYLGNDLSHCVR